MISFGFSFCFLFSLWSGLSAAYKLKLQGLNVTVFEADGRVGGKLRSISRDGLIWDEGANTMVLVRHMKSSISLFYRNMYSYSEEMLLSCCAYIDKFYLVGRLKVRHLLGFCSTILDLGISNNLYDLFFLFWIQYVNLPLYLFLVSASAIICFFEHSECFFITSSSCQI